MREALYKYAFPAENADEKKRALTKWGSPLIPAISIAMMKGLSLAFPLSARSRGSEEGTVQPMVKIDSR